MTRCLCCGKVIKNTSDKANSYKYSWHTACIKGFFGTLKFPDINISEDVLKQIALDSTNKGYTVPGVQKKLSLHLTEDTEPRLTLVNYPTGYILKPQTDEYPALPELEHLIMQMAKTSGIITVPFGMLKLSPQNSFAYITRRIDRKGKQMLAMEDFCQLDGRLTEDKYRGSYERCAKIIARYSINPGLDLSELFIRIIFSFVVGNSDMHLKNFSLIETFSGSNQYILSPAYDMLSTNIVIPTDKEQLALTINGQKQNIRKKDFMIFAASANISENSAKKIMNKIVSLEDCFIEMCRTSYIPDEMKIALEVLITERIKILK